MPLVGVGLWRSLVAHLTGGQGVAGSNPVSPTINDVNSNAALLPDSRQLDGNAVVRFTSHSPVARAQRARWPPRVRSARALRGGRAVACRRLADRVKLRSRRSGQARGRCRRARDRHRALREREHHDQRNCLSRQNGVLSPEHEDPAPSYRAHENTTRSSVRLPERILRPQASLAQHHYERPQHGRDGPLAHGVFCLDFDGDADEQRVFIRRCPCSTPCL